MANQDSGGWWGFLDAVKSASTSIISVYSEELSEFSRTITEDTKQVSETIINVYKEELSEFSRTIQQDTKEIVSTQLQTLKSEILASQAQNPSEDPNQQNQLLQLQNSTSTYVTEVEQTEDFKKWIEKFDMKEKTEEISSILAENEKIRQIHKELVPSVVSYSDFWKRYYYHLHKLNEQEERRAALIKRAVAQNEEELGWDFDDFDELEPGSAKAETKSTEAKSEEKAVTEKEKSNTEPNGGGAVPPPESTSTESTGKESEEVLQAEVKVTKPVENQSTMGVGGEDHLVKNEGQDEKEVKVAKEEETKTLEGANEKQDDWDDWN